MLMNFPQNKRRTTLSPQSNSYSGVADLLAGRRRQSILVVDDNLVNAALLRDLLATRGYEAVAVQSAAAAEAEISRQAPDLILLDVVMPGKSGYEVCRELKGDSKTRLIPIVMITGLSAREDRLKGIEAGADDFLTKPISSEELFARVSSLLKLKEFTDELETVDSVLCTLGLSVEARDPYTEGHCERLARNASDLGRFLGLDEESLVALRRGGFLHDLGKISVPDEILKKGSDLTPAEWAIMKQHPITGEAICRPLKSLRLVLPIIRHHHEHFDGSGYPDGLRGKEIPLLPRILQVVDIYDALRTARPYKPAFGHGEAAITMRHEAEIGLWDGELVSEFLGLLDKRRQAA
jgi:putative two-component system response regulator